MNGSCRFKWQEPFVYAPLRGGYGNGETKLRR